jgi:hypothetical protein
VQSGGSFDVDYDVVGPNERVIMKGEKERQGDFVFTASDMGEYRFCFNNEMSTFAEKIVDFEIAVRTPYFRLTPIDAILHPLSPLVTALLSHR